MFKFFKFLSTSKLMMSILFVIITFSFVFFGMGDIFNLAGRGNAVAIVGDKEITYDEYKDRYKGYLRRYKIETMPIDQQRALGIGNRVISEMVSEQMIESEIKALGLQASDTSLATFIRTNPMFQDKVTGTFNRIQYENILQANGLTESSYAKLISSDITKRQLGNTMNSLFANTPALAERLQQIRGEQRTLDFVVFTKEDAGQLPPAPDDALTTYFEENKTLYTLPATRNVDYVLLDVNDYTDSIDINDGDIQAYYDANKNQFGAPEKRSFNQYLFENEQQAQSAYNTLVTGQPLEDADAIEQLDISKDDLGDSPLAKAIFTGNVGSITKPAEGDFGWVVAKITNVAPEQIQPLNEVRAQIQSTMKQDMAIDALYEAVDKIDGAFTSGASLAEVAKGMDLTLHTFNNITADGLQLADGDTTEFEGENASLAKDKKFLQSISQLTVGETGIAVELPENIFFVASVIEKTDPRTPELSEVKTRVSNDFENTRKANALDKKLLDIVAQIKGGAPLSDFGTVKTETKLTRESQPQNLELTYQTIKPIFEANQGDVITIPVDTRTLLVQIKSIIPTGQPTPSQIQENDKILAEALSLDMLETYDRILKSTHGLQMNQGLIDKIYQQ